MLDDVDIVKVKVEHLSRKYPELPWDSFEQNAGDLGLIPESYDYWVEVLREAQEQTA
jgi:hypothetical protein